MEIISGSLWFFWDNFLSLEYAAWIFSNIGVLYLIVLAAVNISTIFLPLNDNKKKHQIIKCLFNLIKNNIYSLHNLSLAYFCICIMTQTLIKWSHSIFPLGLQSFPLQDNLSFKVPSFWLIDSETGKKAATDNEKFLLITLLG